LSHPDGDWYVIVNPASGRGRGARYVEVLQRAARAAGLRARIELTRARMHAAELAAHAVRDGERRFLCVGGDGTANEMVNGLATQAEVPLSELCVATLPVGTGNDWSRSLGMPRRVDAAVRALRACRPIPCDLGRVTFAVDGVPTSRYFVNVAGVGFDAFVIARLGTRKPGAWAYLAELLRSMRRFEAPTLELSSPGVRRSQPALAVFAGLGRYCGGGMEVAPRARLDDGLLDVTLIGDMSGWQVLAELRRLFDGSLHASRHVAAWSARTLEVDALPGAGVEADGEWLGATPARVEVLERALRVVAPGIAATAPRA